MKQLIIISFLFFFGSAHSAVILLSNGDIINADVIEHTDSNIKISHITLGTLDLHVQKVTSIDGVMVPINTEEIMKSEQLATTNKDQQIIEVDKQASDEKSGLFDGRLRLLRDWEHKLGGGFNGKQGNSNVTIAHVEYRGSIENKERRWDLRSALDFNDGADGDDAQDEFYFEGTHDWLRPDSRWFYFAVGKYEWDEYTGWDNRITGTIGTGYEHIQTQDTLLLSRVGFVGQQTSGGSNPGFSPEVMLGGDLKKTFSEVHSVSLKTAFYHSLIDSEDWSNVSTLDWDIVVNKLWGLGLTLGLENEYEARPDEGDVNNDFQYKLSFVWAWGGDE